MLRTTITFSHRLPSSYSFVAKPLASVTKKILAPSFSSVLSSKANSLTTPQPLSSVTKPPTLLSLQTSIKPRNFFLRNFSSNAESNSLADLQKQFFDEDFTRGGKAVAVWLYVLAGLVFAMVVVGGLTRLTKAGLSMVDWKFTGEKRPSNHEEWVAEFEKYKQYPEFQRMNPDMTLEEFKFIYHMEWGHRMLGRATGLVFAFPFLYFLATKRLQGTLLKRIALFGALGGGQGLVGWWMVKSGLEQPENEYQAVHVSPYRLAAHLMSAFIIYTLLFYTGQQVWRASSPIAADMVGFAPNKRLKVFAHLIAGLVFLTAFSGAFVAGHGAGLIYNEFPMMGGRLIPQDIIQDHIQPVWKNITENTTMVQFNHRWLGITTATLITAFCLMARTRFWPVLPLQARRAITALAVVAYCQVALGISTLLYLVPVPLAATHQAGSLTLLTVALWVMHALRPYRLAPAVQKQLYDLAKINAAKVMKNAGKMLKK